MTLHVLKGIEKLNRNQTVYDKMSCSKCNFVVPYMFMLDLFERTNGTTAQTDKQMRNNEMAPLNFVFMKMRSKTSLSKLTSVCVVNCH